MNLASTSVELTRPRVIEFGLNVNPVRPMSEHRHSPSTFGFNKEQGRWLPGKSGRSEFALRYPQDPERSRALADIYHQYGAIYAPYTEMSNMDLPEDEVKYFGEEFTNGWTISNDISNDCLMYWSDKFLTDCEGDGYYFDNVFPRLTNKWMGVGATAYKLPDGRIQPGYCFWGQRDHFKRLRVLLDKKRPLYRICIHNTRFQFAPIMGFADLAMGGEMATPHSGSPDFMTMYPREFIEVMYNPFLWGYKLSHLYHFDSHSYTDEDGNYDKEQAMKIHRGAMGTMLAHGVDFFNKIDYDRSMTDIFRMVKQSCGGDMEFIPYWKNNGLFKVLEGGKDCAVGVWRGKNAALIIITNYNKHAKRFKVWLDIPKLLPPTKKNESRLIADMENFTNPAWANFIDPIPNKTKNGKSLPVQCSKNMRTMVANSLSCKIKGRDFQAILIANLPLSQGGTGF